MKRFIFITLFFAFTEARAQEGTVAEGPNLYTLNAPDGWVMDTEVAASQGIKHAFYPQTSSWKTSKVVMYSMRAVTDSSSKHRSRDELIRYDTGNMRKNVPAMIIREIAPIVLDSSADKKALIVEFLRPDIDYYSAVAYMAENKMVVTIVITAQTEERYKQNLPAFQALIRSYRWLKVE